MPLGIALVVGLYVLASSGDWNNVVADVLRFVFGLGILVALGYFAQRYARWTSTNFVVTNERVISRSGVVAKKGIEIPLDELKYWSVLRQEPYVDAAAALRRFRETGRV